jgi:hypothetical protein
MCTILGVLSGVFFAVAVLIGLVFLIEYVATHYPNTTLGRICKAIDGFIERLPDDD